MENDCIMKIKTNQLLADLRASTQSHLQRATALLDLPAVKLNRKPAPNEWSILECLEHLNRYGDFYLPEITRQIQQSKYAPTDYFNSGRLGNYFAKLMLPGEQATKMKTFRNMDPAGYTLDVSTVERFLAQQQQMMHLLDQASQVSLSRTKTGISLTPWIRLKLGDTLRVVIYHNERHLVQVERLLAGMEALDTPSVRTTPHA